MCFLSLVNSFSVDIWYIDMVAKYGPFQNQSVMDRATLGVFIRDRISNEEIRR